MPNLNEIRAKHPQYDDLGDQEFADRFHQKFYSDMPREEFDASIGIRQPTLLEGLFGIPTKGQALEPAPAPVPVPPVPPPAPAPIDPGLRQNGTPKDPSGFLGPKVRTDGLTASEMSIGVNIDGKETLIPAMVPGLDDQELNALLNHQEGQPIPESIQIKARDHAFKRMDEGKSPFFSSAEDGLEIDPNPDLSVVADRLQAQQQQVVPPPEPPSTFPTLSELSERLQKGGKFAAENIEGGAELLVGTGEFIATDFVAKFFTEVPAGTINGIIEAVRAGDIDAFVDGFAASQGSLGIPSSKAGDRVRDLFHQGVEKAFGFIDQQVEDYFADKGGIENNVEAAAALNIGLKSLLILAPFHRVGKFQGKPKFEAKSAVQGNKLDRILDLAGKNSSAAERANAIRIGNKLAADTARMERLGISKAEVAEFKVKLDKLEKVELVRGRGEAKQSLDTTGKLTPAQAKQYPDLGFKAANPGVKVEISRVDAGQFHKAITATKQPFMVEVKSLEEYQAIVDKGGKLFLTKDGTAGFGIEGDGGGISLFNESGLRYMSSPLKQRQIQEGVTRLDAFDGHLVQLYSKYGFEAVEALPWDDKFAPEGWPYTQKPDIVFMELSQGAKDGTTEFGTFPARFGQNPRHRRPGETPGATPTRPPRPVKAELPGSTGGRSVPGTPSRPGDELLVPQDVATTTKTVNRLKAEQRQTNDPVQKLELKVQELETVVKGAESRLASAQKRGVNKGARGTRRTKEDRKIIRRLPKIIETKQSELTVAQKQLKLTQEQAQTGEITAREIDKGIVEEAGLAQGIRPKELTEVEATETLAEIRHGKALPRRLPTIKETITRRATKFPADTLDEALSTVKARNRSLPAVKPDILRQGQKFIDETGTPPEKQVIQARKIALARKELPDAPGPAQAITSRTPKTFKDNEGVDLVQPEPRQFFKALDNEVGAIGEGGDGKSKLDKSVDESTGKNPEAKKAREGHKKIRKDLDTAKRGLEGGTIQNLERLFTDRSVAVTDTLKEGFTEKEANSIIAKHDIIPGANSESNLQYEAAHKTVFGGVSASQKKMIDDIAFSRRVVALDKFAGKDREIIIADTEAAKAIDKKLRGERGGPNLVKRARGNVQRAKGKEAKDAARKELKKVIQQQREIDQQVKNLKKSKSIRGVTIKDSAGNFESQSLIKDDFLHPNNTTGAREQAYLDSLPPDVKAELVPRVDALFAIYKDLLVQMRGAGLMTEQAFQSMAEVGDFSPRRFIQHMKIEGLLPQPESKFRKFAKGSKISKADVLHSLDKGSVEALELDSELLMHTAIVRAQASIARNNAAKALYNLVKDHPENDLLKIVHPDADLPAGQEKIFAKIDGETVAISAPEQMASDWINTDPMMNAALARTISHLSGATILRAGATVFNPLFAIKNLPRDMQLIMFTHASKQYSTHLPIAYAQLSADIKATVADVVARGPEYRKAVKQGMGQDYLAQQSEFLALTPRAGATGMNKLKQLGHVMQWVGVTSELMTRMAVRHRTIINGKKEFAKENGRQPTGSELTAIEEHATWVARSYLDFSKGGAFTKFADVGLPYLNASTNAMVNVAKYAKSDPKLFSYKVAQIAMFTAILWTVRQQFPDQDAGISDQEKAGSWIIPLPMLGFKTDRDGNILIPYMRIAKDATTGTIGSLTDYAMRKAHGMPADLDETSFAISRALSVVLGVGGVDLPPSIAALIVLTGSYDPFTERQVFQAPGGREVEGHAEYFNSTNPTWVAMSKFARDSVDWDISAEALRRSFGKVVTPNNPIPIGVDIITRTMVDELPGTVGMDYSEKVRNRFPFIDNLVRYPQGFSQKQLKEVRKAAKERNTENMLFKKGVYDFFRVHKDDPDFKQKLRDFKRKFADEAKAIKNKRGATAEDKAQARLVRKRVNQIVSYQKYMKQLDKIGSVRNMRVWQQIGMLESELGAAVLFEQVWLRAGEQERKDIEKFAKKLPFVRGKAFTGTFNALVRSRRTQERKAKANQ